MQKLQSKARVALGLAAAGAVALSAGAAAAHHSFAMYDQSKTVTLTGVAHQFVAQANHAEIHFYLIGPDGKLAKGRDGKNVTWGIEMAGAAQEARQGVSAATFPPGTIFTVTLNPTRDGSNFGSKAGASGLAVCPWKTPPAPGKTCDSVAGNQVLGARAF